MCCAGRAYAAFVVEVVGAGVVVESLLAAGASDLAASGLAASAFVSPFALSAAGLLPLPRKSVSYQPLPFSWKPAADTSLRSASLPHAGHVTSGASARRCSASSSCAHCEHWYS